MRVSLGWVTFLASTAPSTRQRKVQHDGKLSAKIFLCLLFALFWGFSSSDESRPPPSFVHLRLTVPFYAPGDVLELIMCPLCPLFFSFFQEGNYNCFFELDKGIALSRDLIYLLRGVQGCKIRLWWRCKFWGVVLWGVAYSLIAGNDLKESFTTPSIPWPTLFKSLHCVIFKKAPAL